MKLAVASVIVASAAAFAPSPVAFRASTTSLNVEIRGPTKKSHELRFGQEGTTTLGGAPIDSRPARMLATISEAGETMPKASALFNAKGAAGEDAGMSNNDVLGIAFYSFLIFTIVQTSFAFRARSSAMFADSSAMFVDSGTYLCNMLAERLKSRTLTDEETKLAPHELELRMKLHTLYLELFPPLVSVLTLMYVTCTTFQVATFTLMHLDLQEQNAACQPDLKVMMIFSALNLLLDIMNVTFFARVQQAIINPLYLETRRNEKTPLISNIDETLSSTSIDTFLADDELSDDTDPINLNMCSAWTVSFLKCLCCKCQVQLIPNLRILLSARIC
jgi:hypothetical protein